MLDVGIPSDITNLNTLFQRSDGIGAFRDKFLSDETLKTRRQNRFHYCRIIYLLALVDFAAARHASGMVMGDVLMVFTNRIHRIAFHDLHVEYVVEQLEPF